MFLRYFLARQALHFSGLLPSSLPCRLHFAFDARAGCPRCGQQSVAHKHLTVVCIGGIVLPRAVYPLLTRTARRLAACASSMTFSDAFRCARPSLLQLFTTRPTSTLAVCSHHRVESHNGVLFRPPLVLVRQIVMHGNKGTSPKRKRLQRQEGKKTGNGPSHDETFPHRTYIEMKKLSRI